MPRVHILPPSSLFPKSYYLLSPPGLDNSRRNQTPHKVYCLLPPGSEICRQSGLITEHSVCVSRALHHRALAACALGSLYTACWSAQLPHAVSSNAWEGQKRMETPITSTRWRHLASHLRCWLRRSHLSSSEHLAPVLTPATANADPARQWGRLGDWVPAIHPRHWDCIPSSLRWPQACPLQVFRGEPADAEHSMSLSLSASQTNTIARRVICVGNTQSRGLYQSLVE